MVACTSSIDLFILEAEITMFVISRSKKKISINIFVYVCKS